MKTLTYVDALNVALSADLPEDVKAKLTALRDQTAKRNSAERKPTKAQVANEALKEQVLAVLTTENATVTDIMGKSDALSALSNQKVSALVNALVEDGKAVKEVLKRKSYFRLP
jgi:hypothetical protein